MRIIAALVLTTVACKSTLSDTSGGPIVGVVPANAELAELFAQADAAWEAAGVREDSAVLSADGRGVKLVWGTVEEITAFCGTESAAVGCFGANTIMVASDGNGRRGALDTLTHELGHALGAYTHAASEDCVYGDEAMMCNGSNSSTISEIDVALVCGARTEPCWFVPN